jgi:iron complex transport system substrate-binding protein
MNSNSVRYIKGALGTLSVLAALLGLACGTAAAPAPTREVVKEAPVEKVVEVEKLPSKPTSITVTDIVGRQVTVKAPVKSVLLGEGRQLYVVAALEREDPFKRVVGWPDDFRTTDLDAYNRYKEKFPRMAGLPVFGRPGQADFSVEKAIALKPDVVILNLDSYGPSKETLLPQLAKAGIPSVVVDFRQYPFENTVPSALIMGKLFGQEARAQELVDFYIKHINTVYDKVGEMEQAKKPKPLAFIYRAARFGGDCCGTFGRGNMGLFVERAGGRNLGSEVIPGWSGTVNPEKVLAADPDLIIVTGSNWTHSTSFIAGARYVTFGYDAVPEQSRAQLKAGIEGTPGWTNLQAYKNGRVFGIWHQFYNSPYSFVAFLQFAKWLYPADFSSLDPEAAFKEFHQQFLPLPYSGAFWVSMKEE